MKLSYRNAFIIVFVWNFFSAFAQASPTDDFFLDFKNRLHPEIVDFTRTAGWTVQSRGLSSAEPLGVFGFDAGFEITTIPRNAFHFDSYNMDLPSAFPRLNVAKGLTKYLDLEASLLMPKLFKAQILIPREIESLIVAGGGLKYTMLSEEEYLVSLAGRFSYTRLMMNFFNADIFGGDASISRTFKIPVVALSLTPYGGAGYISTVGEFDIAKIPYVNRGKYKAQTYRYYGGLSARISVINITGQVDIGTANALDRTYSLKASIDI